MHSGTAKSRRAALKRQMKRQELDSLAIVKEFPEYFVMKGGTAQQAKGSRMNGKRTFRICVVACCPVLIFRAAMNCAGGQLVSKPPGAAAPMKLPRRNSRPWGVRIGERAIELMKQYKEPVIEEEESEEDRAERRRREKRELIARKRKEDPQYAQPQGPRKPDRRERTAEKKLYYEIVKARRAEKSAAKRAAKLAAAAAAAAQAPHA